MKLISISCLVVALLCGIGAYGRTDSDTATRVVTAAYEDILGRKPDAAGLSEFRSKMMDQGWSEEQVRKALKASPEYQKTRVDSIINTAYQDLLGRKPDPAGRKLYTEKITKDGWDENKVRAALKASEEYKNKHR